MIINSTNRLLFYGILLGGILSGCAGTSPPQAVLSPPQENPPKTPAKALAAPEGPEAPGVPEGYGPWTDALFIPGEIPDLAVPPGVGAVSREQGEPAALLDPERRRELTESFRTGYREAVLRDLPLIGVLGGDMVHGWPREDPAVWAQNWRSPRPQSQSWGLPSLLLSLEGLGERRVFTVSGAILDQYGKVNDATAANGALGYGAPLGEAFFHEGAAAQRFDRGLITTDPQGAAAFIPEEAPSTRLFPPDLTGSLPSALSPVKERIEEAFKSAWIIGVDMGCPPLNPDEPVRYLSFSSPLLLRSGEEIIPVPGLYLQRFDQGKALFVLADSALLPHARLLLPPFLEVLLRQDRPLPGAESLSADELSLTGGSGGEDPWFGNLARGLALSGLPLTDPLPRLEVGVYRQAQRFSKGWMVPDTF
jgi:hypothetical protein